MSLEEQGFRPLARLIGRYTLLSHGIEQGVGTSPFTAPREVDRYLYGQLFIKTKRTLVSGPSRGR